MSSEVRRIVIVGGGECAARAAVRLRELGFDGSLTIVSDEARSPYERPPLSKAVLLAARDPVTTATLSPERAAALDVRVELGQRVAELEPDGRAITASGSSFDFDRLLLATGARPRALPIPGGDLALTLRSFDDALRLRDHLVRESRVVVIGAGLIGLEVAAAARARGCSVVVLEALPRALGRSVPAEISDLIVKRHLADGVDIRCGAVVERITPAAGSLAVVLARASAPIEADVVVAGVGATPNVEIADAAGLRCDNGILTDRHLQTSAPRVYAAGDCCAAPHALYPGVPLRLESWRNAHDQAMVAAENMLGRHLEWTAVPWFWSDQYELTLQVAGMPSRASREVVRERADGNSVRFGIDRAGVLLSVAGVGRGTTIARDIRVGEMLIAKRAILADELLADPTVSLKSLVRA